MDKGDAVKKFYFPIHLDSGNRGCEAIARGTIQILDILPQNYIGFSREIENDIITGIEKQISYINTKYDFLKKILIKVINKLKIKDKEKYVYYLRYSNFLKTINQDEICFITGGDMLCYGNNQVNYIVDYLHNKNITTVLWGCSFGEENYTSEKFKALSECSLITVRESLTYEYMTNKLGLKQVLLYPDPAFVLAPESINLPSYFENDCVGINLSNFVSGSVNATTCFEKNVINLMEYILSETTMTIVFIPHVFWEEQDDRITCKYFKNKFKESNRIQILDTYKLNYCQIRYAISKCRFFLGARTHAMISAYSVCVPSIALGYSIKSKGISKDLKMPDYTLIDYRNLKKQNELLGKYKMLQQNEHYIRKSLEDEIQDYIQKAYDAKECILRLGAYNDKN